MPRVQSMDNGDRNAAEVRWIAPPDLPVRKPTQVHHAGDGGNRPARKETRSDWPFLYSYRADTVIINKAQRTSKYKQALAVGEAQF